MYATNAFAIRKIVREILIEKHFYEGFGFDHNIDGKNVPDLESWMLNVTDKLRSATDIYKDIQASVEQRGALVKSHQNSSQTLESPPTTPGLEC